MKLISMTDFVLEQSNNTNLEKHLLNNNGHEFMNVWNILFSYANFLKQKLEIWMFVPAKLVDGEWVVLEEPNIPFQDSIMEEGIHSKYANNLKQYQEAKERVLFEGVEYTEAKYKRAYSIVKICKSLSSINYPKFWTGLTIETLIPYKLVLTQSAIKQIGL